jgi:cation diffusion facilitator family transporter
MGYTKQGTAGGVSDRVGRIKFVLWVILVLNLGVALAKLAWGIVSSSVAMQADGFHSLFDGTSNIVGLIGMGFAARPADRDHPYGHGKYETYASAAIGAMLVIAAYRVGSTAVARLTGGGSPAEVTTMSFVVMIGTLSVNLFVTLWERSQGKKLGSSILVADASHTLSDAFVSVGVMVGLVFVRLGFERADAVTALVVSVAIVYTAWKVFRSAGTTLSDASRIPASEICEVVMKVPGVLGCHTIRTRGSEAEVYVDMHIQVDRASTVADGHSIAEATERAVGDHFESVVDVIAHLEPMDEYQAEKTAAQQDSGLV